MSNIKLGVAPNKPGTVHAVQMAEDGKTWIPESKTDVTEDFYTVLMTLSENKQGRILYKDGRRYFVAIKEMIPIGKYTQPGGKGLDIVKDFYDRREHPELSTQCLIDYLGCMMWVNIPEHWIHKEV